MGEDPWEKTEESTTVIGLNLYLFVLIVRTSLVIILLSYMRSNSATTGVIVNTEKQSDHCSSGNV